MIFLPVAVPLGALAPVLVDDVADADPVALLDGNVDPFRPDGLVAVELLPEGNDEDVDDDEDDDVLFGETGPLVPVLADVKEGNVAPLWPELGVTEVPPLPLLLGFSELDAPDAPLIVLRDPDEFDEPPDVELLLALPVEPLADEGDDAELPSVW